MSDDAFVRAHGACVVSEPSPDRAPLAHMFEDVPGRRWHALHDRARGCTLPAVKRQPAGRQRGRRALVGPSAVPATAGQGVLPAASDQGW